MSSEQNVHLALGAARLSRRSQINWEGASRALGGIFPSAHCSTEILYLQEMISKRKCFGQTPATKGKCLTLSFNSRLMLVTSRNCRWLVEPKWCFLTSTDNNKTTQWKEHNYVKQSYAQTLSSSGSKAPGLHGH